MLTFKELLLETRRRGRKARIARRETIERRESPAIWDVSRSAHYSGGEIDQKMESQIIHDVDNEINPVPLHS